MAVTSSKTAANDRANDISAPGSVASENALTQQPNVKYPSTSQDISSILDPYVKELQQLGPEYQKEMDYLAPYLSGSQSTGLPSAPTYSGPDSAAVNSADAALGTAEQNVASATENEPAPGFGKLADAAKEYEGTIEPSAGIQSALAYQKYLATYGGMQADTSDWSQQAKDAYAAILGESGTEGGNTSGLPGITEATSANQASTNANAVQQQLTNQSSANLQGGGNAS
jgi:hypothetical protein